MTVTCYAFNFYHRIKRYNHCLLMYTYLIFFLFSTILVDAAPHKSKNKKYDGPQLVYDQKQSGDYNIQVHLKDFQIIAMLGDDVLGDYDYNYDYADFTIKPSGSTSTSTTPKPSSSSPPPSPPSTTPREPPSTPSTSEKPLSTSSELSVPSDLMISDIETSSSENPSSVIVTNAHPYPIEVVVPQSTKKPEEDPGNLKIRASLFSSNTEKSGPVVQDITSQDLTLETTLNLISNSKPASASQPFSSPSSQASYSSPKLSSTPSPAPSPPSPISSPPGKIKVQILGASSGLSAPSLGIEPGEEPQGGASQGETNGDILQSELASYRRCTTGYARDKKGRCRRVRRPGLPSQLPFGFSRLASSLATRLRLTSPENPAVTSISTEK